MFTEVVVEERDVEGSKNDDSVIINRRTKKEYPRELIVLLSNSYEYEACYDTGG